jgi:Ca2+-binding EF-hand superfamily protein
MVPQGVQKPSYWIQRDSGREGDVNGDGCVDDTDLQMLLAAFGQSGAGLREDMNGDGVVDDSDLLVVLAHYGSGC